jgi:GAF domain-containing protein
MSESKLSRLHDLTAFVREEEDLRSHLKELGEAAASMTGAGACSIMLLSEGDNDAPRLKLYCSTAELPDPAWSETPGRGESIAGRVLEHGAPLLIADIRSSEFAPLARQRKELGTSFVGLPINVGQQVIGVMNLTSAPGSPPFDESDLVLGQIVAALIGKSVQVERLQTLIRSRFAHQSLAREEKEVVDRIASGTVPTARVAKLLARSFFRDLANAGFEPGQIIDAASEIVALISSDIKRFRKRAERESR